MKKLVFVFIAMMLCIGCSRTKYSIECSCNDSIVLVEDTGEYLMIPLDSFLQIEDSFIHIDKELTDGDIYWMTKEKYKWIYGFPDTIIVVFTRDGKFVDSVKAVRQLEDLYDSTGKKYSPAYVFRAATGDNWIYDVNGKFIEYNCYTLPQSGGSYQYKP